MDGDFENYISANDLKSLKKCFYEQVIEKIKKIPAIYGDDPTKLKEAGIYIYLK